MCSKREGGGDVPECDSKRLKCESLKKEEATPMRRNVLQKLEKAAPFYFFLTRVQDEPGTHTENLSITLPELLSLGDLEHSVHFTFMVQVKWMMAQYKEAGIENPSIDVYHDIKFEGEGFNEEGLVLPDSHSINLIPVDSGLLFGHHHTKMSLQFYKDGSARVVIYTANLIEANWKNETQGVWVSPLLPVMLNTSKTGESVTNFKTDLLEYLKFYQDDDLKPWIDRLQKVDMSAIMVCFVSSVPGTFTGNEYGYRKLQHLLTEHRGNPNPDWKLIVQCSSIGSLGKTPTEWLRGSFGRALSPGCDDIPPLSVIYPSRVMAGFSWDRQCLSYTEAVHKKQTWLKDYLCQWMSEGRYRTEAMPHVKTYAQVSPDGKKAGWLLMTSANLSKAAWGKENKPNKKEGTTGLRILAYEVGVLFLPKFLMGKSEFCVRCDGKFSNEEFPFPYDLPLTPYDPTDEPYMPNIFDIIR